MARLKKELGIYLASVVALIVIMSLLYVQSAGGVATLRAEEEDLTSREMVLRNKVKKVNELNEEEAGLQLKLNVIGNLEARRQGPVRILEEVSRQIPANRAWLVHLDKAGDNLTLKGIAMDNETVADFIENLKSLKQVEGLLKALEDLEALLPQAEQMKDLEGLKAGIEALKALRPAPLGLVGMLEVIEAPEGLVAQRDKITRQIKSLRKGRIRTGFYFDNVDLVRSTEEVRNEMRLKSFSVTCDIVFMEEAPTEEDQAQQGKAAK